MKFKLKYVVYGTVITVVTTFAVSSFVGCSKPEDNPKENPCIDNPCQCDPNAPGCKEEPCVKNPCLCNENAPGCKEDPKTDVTLKMAFPGNECGLDDPAPWEVLEEANLLSVKNDPKTGTVTVEFSCAENMETVSIPHFRYVIPMLKKAKELGIKIKPQTLYITDGLIELLTEEEKAVFRDCGLTLAPYGQHLSQFKAKPKVKKNGNFNSLYAKRVSQYLNERQYI
jgi:hypothetical protein